jgi:hypothetical protein
VPSHSHPHCLNIKWDRFVTTSIGLIIRRKLAGAACSVVSGEQDKSAIDEHCREQVVSQCRSASEATERSGLEGPWPALRRIVRGRRPTFAPGPRWPRGEGPGPFGVSQWRIDSHWHWPNQF